ncbi:hypothetical protein [Streptomyces sp. NPDC090132]|uniref:hypothetical protein n=1 Tax=Streptomyces sp. NPDC090132 TaxID=3365955 RepID=UPI00381F40BB
MIRADRVHLVRTLADIAEQRGVRLQTLLNSKLHQAVEFPEPISAPGARTRLYDGEQIDAYLTGRPVPALPDTDTKLDDDLLDRQECAAVRGVAPRTWDAYKTAPRIAERLVVVAGVEHWPRSTARSTPAPAPRPATAAGGRPARTGDQVPRDQLLARTAPLLDADPGITSAGVVAALGVHRDTAQDALTQLRADRMADLMAADPNLTAQQAARTLHYPPAQTRRATVRAQTVLRARQAAPYLASVGRELHRAGWTSTHTDPTVQHPADDVVAAVILLDGPLAPAPALVWDERAGWRTATSRRHPLGRGAAVPPPSDGTRYLATGTTPHPAVLRDALS